MEQSRPLRRVALAYTVEADGVKGSEFFQGRAAIDAFSGRKWQRAIVVSLIKEVWGSAAIRMAVRFVYESHDSERPMGAVERQRSYGVRRRGLMCRREASLSTTFTPIREEDRSFAGPRASPPRRSPRAVAWASEQTIWHATLQKK